MSTHAHGGPAFPVPYSNEADGPTVMPSSGMTLRDYFAAKAMQAALLTSRGSDLEQTIEICTQSAYKVADAMLKARQA